MDSGGRMYVQQLDFQWGMRGFHIPSGRLGHWSWYTALQAAQGGCAGGLWAVVAQLELAPRTEHSGSS